MKNKAFTLIELLAVIVILAIIALISTPIVLSIIENVKMSSVVASMQNIEKAADLYYQNKQLDEEVGTITFICKGDKCINNKEELELNGKAPENGRIILDEDGNITFDSIVINGYSCIKENSKFVCEKANKVNESSESGIITINNSKISSITNYRIYGNSIQEGTPTPDNPKEIKSVGDLVTDINNPNHGKYEIKIKVVGKNLFDIEEYVNNANEMGANGTISLIDNGILQKTIGYQQDKSKMKIKLKSNTQYTFSSDIEWLSNDELSRTGFKIYYVSGDVNQINVVPSTEKINFKTIKNDTVSFISSGGWTYDGVVKFSNIQLEEGTEKTEYEQYSGRKYSIYLDEPLRCVEDVCDYIDFESNKVVRNIKEYVYDGNEHWNDGYLNSNKTFIFGLSEKYYFNLNGKQGISNRGFTIKCGNTIGSTISVSKNNSDEIFNYGSSADEWKNWLSTHNLQILYPLKTLIEEPITLPYINLNKDVSNIIVDTEIQPSKIELEYYK